MSNNNNHQLNINQTNNSDEDDADAFIHNFLSANNVDTYGSESPISPNTNQVSFFNENNPNPNIHNPNHVPFFNQNNPSHNIPNPSIPFDDPNIPFSNPSIPNPSLSNSSYTNLLSNQFLSHQTNPTTQLSLYPRNNIFVGESSQCHDSRDAPREARHEEMRQEEAANKEAPPRPAWDDHRPLLPWIPEQRKFATNERNSKCGISNAIRKTFELKPLPGTTWGKIPEETKEWYWEEFQKLYKWDPKYDRDVKVEWGKRCSKRLSDCKNKLITKQKRLLEARQSSQEVHGTPAEQMELPRPHCIPPETWRSWVAELQTPEFQKKSKQGKLNRRRGNLMADALPTYRGGSLSANRLREQLEQQEGNVDPIKLLSRTKGVVDKDGQRVLVQAQDKELKEIYDQMEVDAQSRGEPIDRNKLYLKAYRRWKEQIRSDSGVYGLGSATQHFYPNHTDLPHTNQKDQTTNIEIMERIRQLERIAHEMQNALASQLPNVELQQQNVAMQQHLLELDAEVARLRDATFAHIGSPSGSGGSQAPRRPPPSNQGGYGAGSSSSSSTP